MTVKNESTIETTGSRFIQEQYNLYIVGDTSSVRCLAFTEAYM